MFNTYLLWVCQFPVISTAHQWNSSHAESQASSHPRQYHKLQNSVLHPSKRRKCWFLLHKNLTFGRHLISARECCTSKTGTVNTRWAPWKFVFCHLLRSNDLSSGASFWHARGGILQAEASCRDGICRNKKNALASCPKYQTREHEIGHKTLPSCCTVSRFSERFKTIYSNCFHVSQNLGKEYLDTLEKASDLGWSAPSTFIARSLFMMKNYNHSGQKYYHKTVRYSR